MPTVDNRHRLCARMWQMREALRQAPVFGREKLSQEISLHFKTCSICYDWWLWMWQIEPSGKPIDEAENYGNASDWTNI